MRFQQLGITHDTASARLTQDWKGNDTVTVQATVHLGENNSQTTPLQLTEGAAKELLSALLLATRPWPETKDVRVVFRDADAQERTDVTFTRRERAYELAYADGTVVYIERDDVSFVEVSPHKP